MSGADVPPRFGSRVGLRARLLLLVLSVVVLLQLGSALAVQLGTAGFVRLRAGAELETAERVWQRFYELRARRLLSAVSVLAEDFGFREAVASGDSGTGLSALLNHAGRVDADLALLLGPDGEPLLAVPEVETDRLAESTRALLAASGGQPGLALVELQGVVFQLALVPVRAPERIGWAGFGFALSDAVLADYQQLVGVGAQVFDEGGQRLLAASDAAPAFSPAVLQAGRTGEPQIVGDAVLRRLALPSVDGSELPLVLHIEYAQVAQPLVELRRRILLSSLLVALPALLLALWAARGITRPLAQLVAAVSRIARGDYEGRLEVGGRDEVGRLASAVASMQSAIRERESRIEAQSRTDALTGLANRGRALQVLESIAAERGSPPRRLVLLDVRRFAEINDSFGQTVGDQVLAELGRRLQALASGSVLARLGADQFMLLEAATAKEDPQPRLLEWLQQLAQPCRVGEADLRLELWAGWASFPDDAAGGAELLRRAQLALSDAKREGLGLCRYRPGREDRHLRQLRLMADLRVAEARGDLTLVYQPKVALVDGRLCHVEALLRWRHPELGPVGPDEFVPLAERAGLVQALTRFVLAEALRQCAAWESQGIVVDVAVNLSALDLAEHDLVTRVAGLLEATGLPGHRLILEVTESAVVRDVELAIRQLSELRVLGVRIAVDDFGTGQSSLAQLQRLPCDELKIDKSFVLDLAEGSAGAEIVRITVELGHRLGLRVVAEGVESMDGLAVLRSMQCDYGQGYLFSRPLPPLELPAWRQRFAFASLIVSEASSGEHTP